MHCVDTVTSSRVLFDGLFQKLLGFGVHRLDFSSAIVLPWQYPYGQCEKRENRIRKCTFLINVSGSELKTYLGCWEVVGIRILCYIFMHISHTHTHTHTHTPSHNIYLHMHSFPERYLYTHARIHLHHATIFSHLYTHNYNITLTHQCVHAHMHAHKTPHARCTRRVVVTSKGSGRGSLGAMISWRAFKKSCA